MTAPDDAAACRRAGAYAALQRHHRQCPLEPQSTFRERTEWYDGFDEARLRLAVLEGELVRGEGGP